MYASEKPPPHHESPYFELFIFSHSNVFYVNDICEK
jgi:hypothetical protein